MHDKVAVILLAMILLQSTALPATSVSGMVKHGKTDTLLETNVCLVVAVEAFCRFAEGIQADEYLKLIGGKKEEPVTETVPEDPDYLLADDLQVCRRFVWYMHHGCLDTYTESSAGQ